MAMQNWAVRNLPHAIYWGDGNHTIEARYSSRLLVLDMYESTAAQSHRVSLAISIEFGSAKILDLTGNGYGESTNNKGIGTLLFNLAIQFMKCIFYDRIETVVVSGTTCPLFGPDSPLYERDVQNRAKFWSSFNLTLDDPKNGRSSMKALLKDLCLKDRGMCLGKINTLLSINGFWRSYHRPKLFPNEVNALRELDLDIYSIKTLPTKEELNKKEKSFQKGYLYFLLGICGFSLFKMIDHLYSTESISFKSVGIAIGLTLLLYFLLFRLTTSYFNKFFSVESEREHSELIISAERKKLADLNYESPGIFKRMYDVVIKIWPAERSKTLSSSNEFHEYDQNLKAPESIIEWHRLIENFKAKYYHQINSKRLSEEYCINDFLFNFTSNNVRIEHLERYSSILNGEFEHHINRLLNSIESHELFIYGNSDANPKVIIKNIRSIAMIVLYTNESFSSDIACINMKLILKNGTINFQPGWSAYKEIRRKDTINALSFLLDDNYLKKTFIRDGENLIALSKEPKEFILQLFDLANCRNISEKELNEYVDSCDSTLRHIRNA
jgi:hypothetical protein